MTPTFVSLGKNPTASLLPFVVTPHRLAARASPASSSVLFRLRSCALTPLRPLPPSHLASPPPSPPRLSSRIHKRTPVCEGRSHTSPEGGGRLLAWPRPRRRIRAGNLKRMRGDGLRVGPLVSCCEEPSPRVAAAWIQLCARRKNRTKNRSRLLHPLTSEHAVAAGSRGRAEQRHQDVAGQSIVALEGAMVTRRGRTEAVKSAADGIRPDAPDEGDQATGEHSHDGKACVAVGLPGRERERLAFHCQVASTSARQTA
jgi:hypothetical protein